MRILCFYSIHFITFFRLFKNYIIIVHVSTTMVHLLKPVSTLKITENFFYLHKPLSRPIIEILRKLRLKISFNQIYLSKWDQKMVSLNTLFIRNNKSGTSGTLIQTQKKKVFVVTLATNLKLNKSIINEIMKSGIK